MYPTFTQIKKKKEKKRKDFNFCYKIFEIFHFFPYPKNQMLLGFLILILHLVRKIR